MGVGVGGGSRRDLFSAMEGLISKEWGPYRVTIPMLMFCVSFDVAERYCAGDIASYPLGFFIFEATAKMLAIWQ